MKKLMVLFFFFISLNADDDRKPQQKPKPSEEKNQQSSTSVKNDDAPISQEEASAVLQVAGGFLQILTAPQNPTNITTGIGIMASGMANLFYQLMKSRGFNPELSDEELLMLAHEMELRVNRTVEIELIKRNFKFSE